MKVTLSDIAQKTNVTVSTVQRALNGGGGVSEAKKAEIQKVANEMGYQRNSFGSALRKGQLRIAAVFSEAHEENRFYAHYLWAGVRYFVGGISPYDVELVELCYGKQPQEHALRIKELLDGGHGKIDGVVTHGGIAAEGLPYLKELQEKDIPVALVGTDISPKYRLCCVRTYEQMAGAMAANMFLNFKVLRESDKVIICGNFNGLNQFNNAQGFERELWDSGLKSATLKIPSDIDLAETKSNIQSMLANIKNVKAIYACSARSSISACEAIKDLGMAGEVRLIGSDLFKESVGYLRSGNISALIHNRPYSLAQLAMQALVNYITGDRKLAKDTILINADIVMKGNVDFYLHGIPAFAELADPERVSVFEGAPATQNGSRIILYG